MSRYLLLILLNIPFIFAGLLSALVTYKTRKSSRRKFAMQVGLWLAVLLALILAHPIYEWLFSHNLTQTEPLSLFDVVQITSIVLLFYSVSRLKARTESLEHRLRDLHQELSIILSKEK